MKASLLTRRTIKVKVLSDTLTVIYRLDELTEEYNEWVREEDENGKVKTYTDAIVRLVEWWDLTEDDGSMVELSHERVAQLPAPFKRIIMQAIDGDADPNSLKTARPSQGTSAQKAK